MWPKYSFFKPFSDLCTSARRHYALKNCSLFFFCDWTSLLAQNRLNWAKGRSGSPLCLEGRFSTNHWSRIEQCLSVILRIMKSVFFSGAASSHRRTLLTPGCCITASVLWNDSSPPGWPSTDWVMRSSVVWCYCMQFYRRNGWVCTCLMFSGVLARGVLCPDVWMWCESAAACQPILCVFLLFLFLFSSQMIKLLSIYHVSNLDA